MSAISSLLESNASVLFKTACGRRHWPCPPFASRAQSESLLTALPRRSRGRACDTPRGNSGDVGGAGTLFCAPGLRVVDSGAIPEAIMGGVRPLGDFYLNTLMNENDIDWTFFSPAGAFDENGERTGKFRLGKDNLIIDENGNSHISVQDYALAMVDELEKEEHHKERFTIGY